MSNKPLIIITGASSGIGSEVAKVFSQAGYPLGLFARNLQAMQQLALPNAICCQVDMTQIKQVKEAVNKVEAEYGTCDGLINNAGVAQFGEFTEIDHQQQHQMVDVNIHGVINGIESVLPQMQNKKHGTIINLSSIADRKSRPTLATYAATKAAVRSLSESLRTANAKHNIRICNLAPAKILTPMMNTAGLSENQTIAVEDFAKAILWVYQQPQNICIRDMVFAPTAYED